MSEVPARRVESFDDLANPGDFMFTHNNAGEIVGMIEMCPCGCRALGSIAFKHAWRDPGERPVWEWNGSKDKPTLTPSVQRTEGCKWHGWLKGGVWKSC